MVGRIDASRGRGVSPVIGVVLMVAITVVLASAAAFLFLGMSDETNQRTPQVAITTTYDERTDGDGESLTVEFESGDVLTTADVSLTLHGAVAVDPAAGTESSATISGDPLGSQAGSQVKAGEQIEIDATSTTVNSPGGEYLDLSDATLRLVWNPADPEIEHSEVLWRWSPQ